MQQAIPSGTTVVVLAQPASQSREELYKNMRPVFSKALVGLGAVQLSIGVLCFIFQCVSVGLFYAVYSFAFVGHGFWNGVLFLITGIFGIVGGRAKSRCEVVSFNVFSIMSACFSIVLFGIATASATQAQLPPYRVSRYQNNVVIAMESMLAILAVIEGVVAISSSAVCCAIGACCCECGGCCCCCPEPPPQPQFPAAVVEQSPQQYLQQPSQNQWTFSQNQPRHHVQPSGNSYQHRYDSLQNEDYTHIGSAPRPRISDNHSYKEINQETERLLPYN